MAQCPLAFVWGDESKLVDEEVLAYFRETVHDTDTPMLAIPLAQHHVMIDQPLALVAALRGLFAVWPGTPKEPLALTAAATAAAWN